METDRNIVEMKGLCKAYGEHTLFENFDLEIERGDFIVFSGKSGCGKTTLLNMIGALEPADQGLILVNGIDIGKRKKQITYFQEVVGFIFQSFALIEEKTVRQNLELVHRKNPVSYTHLDVYKRQDKRCAPGCEEPCAGEGV